MNHPSVKVGSRVPMFNLENQHGENISISQFLGKPFILYFYPKDDTPGCTAEACSFRDAYQELRDLDAEVIGISADSPESHLAFAKRYDLPFVLLSDINNEVRKLFGVKSKLFGMLPGRVTYIVDANGIVQHIFDAQFMAKKHVRESLEHLKKQEVS